MHLNYQSIKNKSCKAAVETSSVGGMETRTIGQGLEVSALGYGAMVLIGLYGEVGEEGALAALAHALDRGVTLIDTADAYGAEGSNELLVGRAVAGRADVVVATKWGVVAPGPNAHRVSATYENEIWIDARPERAAEAADASLRRLGVETIDLWYLHFPDPGVPIEESVGAMAELVRAGKIRHIGLSNVSADELRRAHEVHPVCAVQTEWSLWTRDPEQTLVPVARELGVGVVAWGPLGNGFLAGDVRALDEGDFRHNAPRFQGENLRRNVDRFAPLRTLASDLEVTPAQLALAWLLHQGEDVIPIPGTRSVAHIDENVDATQLRLSREVLDRIDELVPAGVAAGEQLLVESA
jgi:aryl-alcohol dehydrogenase-like predicted oxidoreductase